MAITIRNVERLQPGEVLWDAQISGFGCRCLKSGRRNYFLKYRSEGRQRWLTIGPHGAPWTPATARNKARELLGTIAGGSDPAEEREAKRKVLLVSETVALFLEEHVRLKLKPTTAKDYTYALNRHVLPTLGKLRLEAVTRSDIARLHAKMRATPRRANTVLAILSKLFNWAEARSLIPRHTNPCLHIERFPERRRERFLSEAELAALGAALERAAEGEANPYALAAIQFLVLTGMRVSEVLSLKWDYFDRERGLLLLPDSKTGAKAIYLSGAAIALLDAQMRLEGNPFVFPGNIAGGPISTLQGPWQTVRSEAGLADVRLHDLRHTHAAFAASGGLSLPIIGRLLGHANPSTTARYAHLQADPLKAASNAVAERLQAAMAKRPAREGGPQGAP